MILKHAWSSRPSGESRDDDYDVLAADGVVGRIRRAAASPRECHGCGRWPTDAAYGYEATREAA